MAEHLLGAAAQQLARRPVCPGDAPLSVEPEDGQRGIVERELRQPQLLLVGRLLDGHGQLVPQFGDQRFYRPALLHIVVGTVVDGLYDHLLLSTAGQEDEGHVPPLGMDHLQEIDAVGPGHVVVADQRVWELLLQRGHGVLGRGRGLHDEALLHEERAEHFQKVLLIVDYQHSGCPIGHLTRASPVLYTVAWYLH